MSSADTKGIINEIKKATSTAKAAAAIAEENDHDDTSSDEELLTHEPSSSSVPTTGKGKATGRTTTKEEENEGQLRLSCDIIRRNTTMYLATMEVSPMKFLEMIGGIPEEDFQLFMSQRGRNKGRENPFYLAAHTFFEEKDRKEREERKQFAQQSNRYVRKRKSEALENEGFPDILTTVETEPAALSTSTIPATSVASQQSTIKSIVTAAVPTTTTTNTIPVTHSSSAGKKQWVKPEIDQLIDQVNQIELPDYERVYDDCDEIRRKISVFVDEEAGSITKYSFAIRTTPSVVNRFLARKGKDQGAGSEVYKKSYFFFERLRVLRNEPKSKHRLQSEKDFPDGYPLKNPKGEK